MAKVCFFARVKDRAVLDRVEFYAQDLRILRDLGHDVHVAIRPTELVRADLYFCWWWTWAFVPLAAARLAGRPALVTGVFDEWAYDARPRAQRALLALALRTADANVFISELETRVVPARFRTRRPSYSPCIVDTAAYAPMAEPAPPREPLVLTVAWLHAENAERKGIPEVIRAAPLVRARVPGVRFVIAGERGSGYPALRALAEELGVADIIDFRGVISPEEKVALMQRCGAYLQPSRFEGFGLAVLEAMSCGAPVVASAGGALPEVVGDAGVVLRETSPTAIADAVAGVLGDPAAGARLGARARARAVETFSFERRRADLEREIDALLARG
jgi:glycosyltransferase involved in cell wall biosynthesis